MSGYSCMRESKYNGYKVYGKLKLPTYYAGKCPSDAPGADDDDYLKNILPEMFFGMYDVDGTTRGMDIGIRLSYNATWRPVIFGSIFTNSVDGAVFPSSKVTAGTTLYMSAWVEKIGDNYYAKLNISKTGYTNTDLMSAPISNIITDSEFGPKALSTGVQLRRENAIASNPSSFETSGCYSIGGQWLQCGYVTTRNVTYTWRDSNSAIFTTPGAVAGASGLKVLELRKDGTSTYNASRIKLTAKTDTTSGATETVSIDFKQTPTI